MEQITEMLEKTYEWLESAGVFRIADAAIPYIVGIAAAIIASAVAEWVISGKTMWEFFKSTMLEEATEERRQK